LSSSLSLIFLLRQALLPATRHPKERIRDYGEMGREPVRTRDVPRAEWLNMREKTIEDKEIKTEKNAPLLLLR